MNKEEKTFKRVLKMINDYNHCSYNRGKKLKPLIREALPSVKDHPEATKIVDNLLSSYYNLIEDEDIFDIVKYIVRQTSLRSWKTFEEYMNKMQEMCSRNRLPKSCTKKSLDEYKEETLKWSLKESLTRSNYIRIINADKKPFKFEPVATVAFEYESKEYLRSMSTDREYCLSSALRGDPTSLLIYIATDLKNGVIDARLFPLMKHFALDAKWDTRNLHSSTEIYESATFRPSAADLKNSKPAPKELSRTFMLLKYMTYRFGACVNPNRDIALAHLLKCCCVKGSYGSFIECCKDDWKLPYLQLLLDEYEYCHKFPEYLDVLSGFFANTRDPYVHIESSIANGNTRLIAQLMAFDIPNADYTLPLPQDILQYAQESLTKNSLFEQRDPIPKEKIAYYRGLSEFDIDNLSKEELAQMRSVALTDTRCAFTLGSYYFNKADEGNSKEINYMTSARFFSYGTGNAAYINRIICLENAVNMSNHIWLDKVASTYKQGSYVMCAVKYILTQHTQSLDNFDKNVKDIIEQYCGNGKDDKNAHLVQIAYGIASPIEEIPDPYSFDSWKSRHRSSGDSLADYMQYVIDTPSGYADRATSYRESKYSFDSYYSLIKKYKDEIREFEIGVFANGINDFINHYNGTHGSRYAYLGVLDIGIEKDSLICKRLKAHFLCSNNSAYSSIKNRDKTYGRYDDYDKRKDEEEAYEIILSLNGKYGTYRDEFEAIINKHNQLEEAMRHPSKTRRSKRR